MLSNAMACYILTFALLFPPSTPSQNCQGAQIWTFISNSLFAVFATILPCLNPSIDRVPERLGSVGIFSVSIINLFALFVQFAECDACLARVVLICLQLLGLVQVFGHLLTVMHPLDMSATPALPTIVLNSKIVKLEKDLDLCSICRDVMLKGEIVFAFPCRHFHHKDCMMEWIKHGYSCPCCRCRADEQKTQTSQIQGEESLQMQAQ